LAALLFPYLPQGFAASQGFRSQCLVIAVAEENTIRNLDTYKGYLAKLADPRGLIDVGAKTIIAQAKEN
jgi:hypothetical protein